MKKRYYRAGYFTAHGNEALWLDFKSGTMNDAQCYAENCGRWLNYGELFLLRELPKGYGEYSCKEPCEYGCEDCPCKPTKNLASRLFLKASSIAGKPKNLRESELSDSIIVINGDIGGINSLESSSSAVFESFCSAGSTYHALRFERVKEKTCVSRNIIRRKFIAISQIPDLLGVWRNIVQIFSERFRQLFHVQDYSTRYNFSCNSTKQSPQTKEVGHEF